MTQAGVPLFFTAGKGLDERTCEVRVRFKPKANNMFQGELAQVWPFVVIITAYSNSQHHHQHRYHVIYLKKLIKATADAVCSHCLSPLLSCCVCVRMS